MNKSHCSAEERADDCDPGANSLCVEAGLSTFSVGGSGQLGPEQNDLFFDLTMWLVGTLFPEKGLNPRHPLHWRQSLYFWTIREILRMTCSLRLTSEPLFWGMS